MVVVGNFRVNGRKIKKKVKKSEKVKIGYREKWSQWERERSGISFIHVYIGVTFFFISTVIEGNKENDVFS